MIANVFFDLDGTLTDPQKGITRCFQYALKRLGCPPEPESNLIQFIGPPLRSTLARLLYSEDKDLIEKAVSYYRERYSEIGIFENDVYPEIKELLFLLYKSYRLYVVTAKAQVFAQKIVCHFGLERYFTAIFGPTLDGRFDNKGELIGTILQELSLAPDDTVMVGDRREDIVAGQSNGTRTIGVTYGYGSREEIAAAQPDYICQRPSDIHKVILTGF
jgi:phosphoglycolate phosphatase